MKTEIMNKLNQLKMLLESKCIELNIDLKMIDDEKYKKFKQEQIREIEQDIKEVEDLYTRIENWGFHKGA